MPVTNISISGYRGFQEQGDLKLAVPSGIVGSGLTIITGPNNSGKSSILECMRARSGHQNVSFTSGTRNIHQDFVDIRYTIDGVVERICSVKNGSSETKRENRIESFSIFVLPSRRAFNPYFGRMEYNRDQYLQNTSLPSQRSSVLSGFEYRLFNTLKDPSSFNKLLYEILTDRPEWTIDQSDQGQYFLKFMTSDHSHSSDGMGEGVVSIFSIIDALHDSRSDSIVAIDEPELSLHPTLQKRLADLVARLSSDRQIIISTHSPYFIDLISLNAGCELARVSSGKSGTKIHQLSGIGKEALNKLTGDNIYNPHVFGLDAKELFFQDDGIILTEGQEDVLLMPRIAKQLNINLGGSFFGWGAGGASNIQHVCAVLNELGFKKVAGIYDSDKMEEAEKARNKFPNYKFYTIPAKDIRTKKARKASDEVQGLLDDKLNLKSEFVDETRKLLESIHSFIS